MKKILLSSALLIMPLCCSSAGEFSSVRASGMGGAFSAVRGGADSIYSNPAGLAEAVSMEMGVKCGSLYESGALGTVGGAVFVWPVAMFKGIPAAIHADTIQSGDSGLQETGLTMAGKLKNGLMRWGGTVNVRSETLSGAQLVTADVGIQSQWMPKLLAGAAVRNLFSGNDPLARITPVLGAEYLSEAGQFSADISWAHNKTYVSGGWEIGILSSLLAGRLGFQNGEQSFVTAGAGVYLWPVAMDVSYAFSTTVKNTADYKLSFRYRFGGEHFSETYLNRAVEKAAALEQRIRRLEEKQSELHKTLGDSMFVPETPREKPAPKPEPAAEQPQTKAAPAPKPEKTEVKPERTEPKARKPAWPQYHRVENGDNLRDISQRYYEDPGKWQLIYRANLEKIVRGRPQVGSELVIPEP